MRFVSALLTTLVLAIPSARALPVDNCCVYPVFASQGRSLSDFVPKDWSIELEARGNLNGLPAVAAVLRQTDKHLIARDGADIFDTNPRELIVVFADPTGDLHLALENHTLIPRPAISKTVGYYLEDKYHRGIEFKKGALRVHLHSVFTEGPNTDFDAIYTFRLRGDQFYLIGYDSLGVTMRGDLATSVDFLSRHVVTAPGCIGNLEVVSRCKPVKAQKPLTSRPLLTIEQVGNGLEFRPKLD